MCLKSDQNFEYSRTFESKVVLRAKMASSATIKEMVARDVRFPTSFQKDGSDAIHPGPDYSMVYIELIPSSDEIPIGTGLSFTLGRGNELVLHAVDSLRFLVLGKEIKSIQGRLINET